MNFARMCRPVRRTHLLAAALALLGPVARAEERGTFPAERLRAAFDADSVVDVESARVGEHGTWSAGLWLGWANDPLVLRRLDTSARVGSLVGDRAGAGLFASVGLFGRVQLGLELPVVLYQRRGGDLSSFVTSPLSSLAPAGLGDLRVAPKFALLRGDQRALELSFTPGFTLPTGGSEGYRGEAGFAVQPELQASRRFGALRVASNLSVPLRSMTVIANQVVESEILLRAGAAWTFRRETTRPIDLAGAILAGTSLKAPFAQRNQAPLELRAQVAMPVTGVLQAFVGAGVGLVPGWGIPDWRVFSGVRFQPRPPPAQPSEPLPIALLPAVDLDPDRDGINDPADRCPTDAEDRDGHADADGCPDPDNDLDGLLDAQDRCPQVPEDADGFEDADGCPDTDDDADGLPDVLDRCPRAAEDRDGFADDDGCPDLDDDADGVPDTLDRCPREAGPADNGGCPDTDRDTDTVVDRLDNCPDEAGTVKNQGCRERQLVVITASKIEITESVYFKVDKDVIEKRSYPLLDNVARVIVSHPEIGAVRVEGHTDDQGKAAHNLDLSQRRAAAVSKYLQSKGLAADRLTAKGFGSTQPIASNKTTLGRASNRRVVFAIEGAAAAGIESRTSQPGTDTLEGQ